MNRHLIAFAVLIQVSVFAGCGTTTQRLATEQLLISNAVDDAVSKVDFSHLSQQDVFLDTSYMRNAKGINFANTDYIISSLRQQMAAAGCRLQDDRNSAKIIVEPRIGALGTDGHEVNYGLPNSGPISAAAAALSNIPVLPVLPDISIGKTDEHLAVAKIVIFAYDRESKVAVWQSGISRSESSCRSSWVLGAGPFQKGSIHEGTRFAGRNLGKNHTRYDQATVLAEIEPSIDKLPQRVADAEHESETETETR